MQKIFIVMKNGIVHQINKKIDAMWLHKLLNDGVPFILLEGKGSINKFEISKYSSATPGSKVVPASTI